MNNIKENYETLSTLEEKFTKIVESLKSASAQITEVQHLILKTGDFRAAVEMNRQVTPLVELTNWFAINCSMINKQKMEIARAVISKVKRDAEQQKPNDETKAKEEVNG